MLGDGHGGFFAVSVDTVQVHLTHVDGSGTTGFTALVGETNAGLRPTDSPRLASDGAGGAYVLWATWKPRIESHVFLTRIGGDGTRDWTRELAAITPKTWWSPWLASASGDSGDVYVGWQDSRDSTHFMVTRIMGTGETAGGWPGGGFEVTAVGESLDEMSLEPDGIDGVIAISRPQPLFPAPGLLRLDRLSPSAARSWTWTTPVWFLSWATPRTAPDGAGGVFLSWAPPANDVLQAQHLTASGEPAPGWPDSGIVVARPRLSANDISNCSDGAGGAYLTWSASEPDDVFALHLRGDGTRVEGWPFGGMDVTPIENHQEGSVAIADGSGGLLLAWEDWRYYQPGWQLSPFAQRLDASGELHIGWSRSGTKLSGDGDGAWPIALAPDGTGGAIIGWYEDRGLMVQRVDGEGRYGPFLPNGSKQAIHFLPASPNPFRTSISCEFLLTRAAEHAAVDVIDLAGRKVAVLMGRQDLPAGSHRVTWDGRDLNGGIAPPGIYLIVVHDAGERRSTKLIRVR